jgi:predicted N-acyltransferase
MSELQFRLLPSLREVRPAAWDALAGSHPALAHAYLATLEETGCVGPGTGWTPLHASLWQGEALVAALPLYEKSHSYGEYVFDWAWAEAYARHGLAYYPKWLAAIPFSPLPGPRLLARDADTRRVLLKTVLERAEAEGVPSLHILFPTDDEAALMADASLLLRQGVQFHWHNAGYRDFEDFLGRLNHDKRKKIRQERRRARAGLDFTWLDGRSATASDWRFFYRCYAGTYAAHRSTPYLTPAFFPALARAMPEAVRLLRVDRDGEPLASAFFLQGPEALYGRYWGAVDYVPCLHFEVCYYAAIDYAIAHGLARLEGGAQGEHKLARGLTPVRTWSAHRLREARFADAVSRYLERESGGVDAWLDELEGRSPFRQG